MVLVAARAQTILDTAGVDRNIKVKDWNDDQIAAIRKVINETKSTRLKVNSGHPFS